VPSGFTPQTIADKMPFSTETTAVNASLTLPNGKAYGNFGTLNSTLSEKGFSSPTSAVASWGKVAYSTDTSTNTSATAGVAQASGMSSSTICYTLGGGGPVATAYKFTVSSETAATISAMNKSVAKALPSGCC
jgi:hypothetical protein